MENGSGPKPGDGLGNGSETKPGDGLEIGSGSQLGSGLESENGAKTENETGEKSQPENSETIGYRPIDRQSLSMKVPAVMDPEAESAMPASPAEASPSNGEKSSEAPNKSTEDLSSGDHSLSSGMDEQYIGNPAGDIYILVTADRAASGGLAAQAAGNTLISNCFTLVNIFSEWEDGEIYAGGMAGIFGGEVRAENSYASGLVDCVGTIAGFAAVNRGEIQNCYSSASVSQRAWVRGAFTVVEQGNLSGCVYDRQMSCTGAEDNRELYVASAPEAEASLAGFALKGLNTVEMTGLESQVPGDWYMTDQAYPQIAYFAKHVQEIYAIDSKVSAIALILPAGMTLEDAVSEDGIVLPAEIDGAQIEWQVEEAVNEPIEPHEVPILKAPLDPEETEEKKETGETEETEKTEMTEQTTVSAENTVPKETTQNHRSPKSITFKATTSGITKTFAPVSRLAVAASSTYANWNAVGQAVDTAGSTLESLKPVEDASGYYQIGTPEALAWFAYKVNTDNDNFKSKNAVLTADIDLSGTAYTNETTVNADFTNCLKWSPIGNVPNTSVTNGGPNYYGSFDGGGWDISNLYVKEGRYHSGFFGVLVGATIKNVRIVSGCVNGTDRVGSICGTSSGTTLIENCYNKAEILSQVISPGVSCNTGGIVGCTLGDGNLTISKCVNEGNVTANREAGGILGTLNAGNVVVENCYNLGTVTRRGSNANGCGGIVGTGIENRINISNCFNAGNVVADSKVAAICGNSVTITNCYFQKDLTGANANNSNTIAVDKSAFQSWIAAYALNGLSTDGAWKYTEGDKYPSFGQLEKAESWDVVGPGVEGGFTTVAPIPAGSGTEEDPYQIGNAEQLAWFAYKVNQGNWGLCAKLVNEINLAGTNYGTDYSESNPLPWSPIAPGTKHGDVEYVFKGTFDGQLHTISYMNIKGSFTGNVQSGLFGIVTGIVRNVYIDKISVDIRTTLYACAGAIAGQADLQAVIENCGVLSGSLKASYSGAFAAVGGIVGDMRGTVTIQNCFNRANVTCSPFGSGRSGHASGIAGRQGSLGPFKNCYNTGSVSGAWADGITSKHMGARSDVINCMVETGTCPVTYSRVPSYSNSGMKSWAAAFALNGQSMDGAWAYTNGEYPHFGTLARPDSWQVVGQGILDNLVKGITLTPDADSGVYHIGAPEQLAVFAALVNNGNVDIDASLTMDINLTGVRYGGTMASPIPWNPIGDETKIYKGNFDGAGKAIGYMRVEKDGFAGFFGCAGGGAVITGVGMDSSCKVTSTGTVSGNGTAALVALVKSDETAVTQITIQNCYSRAEVVGAGTKAFTGSFVGNYLGTPGGSETISNCYNAGKITALNGAAGSAIAGMFTHGSGGGIKNCYWDSQTSGGVTDVVTGGGATVENSSGKTTALMKSDDANGLMNLLNTGLVSGRWYRVDTRNDGYPIFKKSESEVTWADVGAAVLAPQSKTFSATPGTEEDPYLIWTAEDLAWFAYQVNSSTDSADKSGLCAELMADIDLFGGLYSGHAYDKTNPNILSKAMAWKPIGVNGVGMNGGYTGTFNGNDHKVSVTRIPESDQRGLFGKLGDGAVIKNTAVSDILAPDAAYLGGIAGAVVGDSVTISACRNTGKVEGTLSNVGGIVGCVWDVEGLVIDGCYNDAGAVVSSPGKEMIGGILGGAQNYVSSFTVRNCYNRGTVSGGSMVGGIVGKSVQNTHKIMGCYNAGTVTGAGARSIVGNSGNCVITDCYYELGREADENAKELSQEVLQTWGAAFALNGEQLSQATGISWNYDAGKNDGYPYPDVNTLRDAADWEDVGEAAFNGLLDGAVPALSGSAYQIATAEQLAWFAYRVNYKDKTIHADLTADLDMVAAESRYVSGRRLSWMPIGTVSAGSYQGVFQSDPDSRNIYQIQNLYVNDAAQTEAGLFGRVSGGKVLRVGIVNADVTGTAAGGIVGHLGNNGEVSQCYNRGGSKVTSSSWRAGGIVGQMSVSTGLIKDCYNINTVIKGGSTAGGIAGHAEGTVKNCYNANLTGGSIAGPDGSYAISSGSADKIVQCYSDSTYGDSAYVGQLDCSDDVKLQTQTDLLNTADGSERKGTARVWFTSLAEEETKGLPTLDAPETYQIELSPAAAETGTTGSLENGISIPDAKLRRILLEKDSTSTDDISLTAADTMTEKFHIYGTDNANVNLGLKAGATDVKGLAQSLADPTASLGTVSQLTLYTAAAYTHAAERILLLEVSSGTSRYEIRITIPGASSKTLSIVLPVEVPIELSPNGTFQKSYSADLALTNQNGYPISGKILRLTAKDDPGYAVLTPVAKDDPFGSTKQIADPAGGVRLGIADTTTGKGIVPAAGIYYTPPKPLAAPPVEETWMEYQIKGQGILPYRYFIEYEANPYYRDTNQYGYTVSYEFGISKEDITGTADAVVK